MKKISLSNLNDKEEDDAVNTPRSKEACLREGIRPEDLLYAPLSDFARPNVPADVQKMNHDLYELQRQKLLKIARDQYSKILAEPKTAKADLNSDINNFVTDEIKKIEKNNLKRMSKLINHKLDNIRTTVENTDPVLVPQKEFSIFSREKSASIKSNKFSKTESSLFSVKPNNTKRDSELLQKEKDQLMKTASVEKIKSREIENRRKINEENLKNYKQKLSELREQEIRQKLDMYKQKEKIREKKFKEAQESKLDFTRQKSENLKNKVLKVIMTQTQYEEIVKDIRDKIIKQENEKIAEHSARKKKIQEEFQKKIQEKNLVHDLKSKNSKNFFDKMTEERKNSMSKELKLREEKIENVKKQKQQQNEYLKQKNKLREIENMWNLQRVTRKDEYNKRKIITNIKHSNEKVNRIKDAKDFMLQLRYDYNIQTESKKDQVKNAIYKMEVRKKFDFKQLKEIVSEKRLSYPNRASLPKSR